MVDFKKLEKKWQNAWEDKSTFKVEVNDKKKFYIAIVYPYMSGLLHVGHLYTYVPSEILMRYKRMQGFNVLAKFGFHCTGSPIVTAAKKVTEKEPSQLESLKKMGIKESQFVDFEKPEHWVDYFSQETLVDLSSIGFSIDARYTFKTTSLNPPYDAFIRWQFNKLKEKGHVKKGKHPVVWCPKCNSPVGDHARSEGEGETPKDFIWVKFRLKDSDLILMAGTTRPDALYGQTHLWIDPNGKYKVVEVNDEKWVVGADTVKKIEEQYASVKIVGDISPKELIGRWAKGPLVDYDVYIVPAWFIDASVGSGIVYSALEDPVDLFELKKIHSNMKMLNEYNLDKDVVAKLKPFPIIKVSGMGDNLGEEIGKEFNITSPDETEKVKAAKDELNKRVFRKGVMQDNCRACSGMTVSECQEYLKEHLVKNGEAIMFYEFTNKVVCRCLTDAIIKMVSDQWFIEYNDPKWKKQAHECLDKMQIFPSETKKQFNYVIDWLNHWACTREFGLGTRLPWDTKWIIESLSDSTIQMAYGTISKYLQHPEDYDFKIDKLNDEFFDYVMLDKGDVNVVEKSTGISKVRLNTMKTDFEYWYPFDFRNSAKDLVQNHLTFCMFNHTAIFPKKHWPKTFMVNGRVMVNNEKMSKSKGNFFTIRELYQAHGADVVRLTAANAGEGINDANYDMAFLETAKKKLSELLDFAQNNYDKGRDEVLSIDNWFESMLNKSVKETTENIENMKFKSAIKTGFLDMQRNLKTYLNRTKNSPNKKMINQFIEVQTKLLAPITPHVCEEIWELIGKEGMVSLAEWPTVDESKIDESLVEIENIFAKVVSDISKVLTLAKITAPKKITLFISESWKYSFFKKLKEELDNTRNVGELIKATLVKGHEKDIPKLIQSILKDSSKLPATVTSQKQEVDALTQELDNLKGKFGAEVEIIKAEDSKEAKSKSASPGKPAILVE